MTNVELVKEAYSHFATGNVPAVLAMFDPAIEWHECKGMPFVKGDGIYTGPEAIVTNVRAVESKPTTRFIIVADCAFDGMEPFSRF